VKNCPNIEKVAKTVAKPNKAKNIFFKLKFESANHLHKTPSENTYSKSYFINIYYWAFIK
jgi:hypothetical protein